MFKSHLARTILCLALVFVLVFNIYAMPTKAIAGEGLFYFGATAVTAALLMGLGIFANQDSTGFDTVHRSFWDHLTELGHIVGDTIPMYTKNGIHYLPKWLVNLGKDWLFETGILDAPDQIEGFVTLEAGQVFKGPPSSDGSFSYFKFDKPVTFCRWWRPYNTGYAGIFAYNPGERFYVYMSSDPSSFSESYSAFASASDVEGVSGYYYTLSVSAGSYLDEYKKGAIYVPYSDRVLGEGVLQNAIMNGSIGTPLVSSSYDVSLGDIATQDEDVLTGMEVWSETAISIPEELQDDDYWNPDPDNDDDDIMVPLGIIAAVLLDELEERLAAQESVQRGEFGYGGEGFGSSDFGNAEGFGPSDFGESGGFGSEDDDQDVTTGPDSDTGTGDDTGTDTETDTEKVTHTRLRDLFDGLGDKLKGWFEGLLSGIQDILDALAGWFDSLIQAVLGIPDKIKEFLIEIFVPSEDYLSEKVNHVRSKFGFAESILATVDLVAASITGSGSEPPVICVELGNAESSYDYGGTVAILDMSWYSTYKPTVDKILSAFLWICFIWKIFKQLPGIIGGMPGDVVFDLVNAAGVTDHLPARKMEYQIHRNEIRRLR